MNSVPPGNPHAGLLVLGWHESVALPELGIESIFAKLDTGADHSVLHVSGLTRRAEHSVEFFAPLLRRQSDCTQFEAGGVRRLQLPIVDERIVRSSNARDERRPVVECRVHLGDLQFTARFSLANREGMRFAVLLGRSALAGRTLVDSSSAHRTTPDLPCPFAETQGAR